MSSGAVTAPPTKDATPAFRRSTQALAALVVAEGLVGAGLGLWVAAQLAWYADMAWAFEVRSPVWAAFAAGQVALTWIVPALALAAMGRRWFGRPALGGSRRVLLYVVLIAHVLAAVLGVLAASWPAAAIGLAGSLAAVATLVTGVRAGAAADQGAGGGSAAPNPGRWGRWGRTVLAAAVLVLLVAGAAGAVAALDPGDDDDLFELGYPEEAVACRGAVGPGCAATAARRAGAAVAWLPDRGSRESRVLVVPRPGAAAGSPGHGRAFQEGRDGWIRFTLYTNPSPAATGPAKRTVVAGGTVAELRLDTQDLSSVDLDWTHGGVAYRLTTWRISDDVDSVVAAARDMLADVRYAGG